jgi:hypothetical protein
MNGVERVGNGVNRGCACHDGILTVAAWACAASGSSLVSERPRGVKAIPRPIHHAMAGLTLRREEDQQRIPTFQPAYGKALNILNRMPVQKDFVTEREAQKFSEQLAQEMAAHP